VRLLDDPVSAGDDPRARVYIVDHLAPGAVIHRRIEVSNTAAAAHIVVYAAAASIATGSFLGAAGHTPNDVSSWTSVRPSTADIPHDAQLTATVTIAVPRDAASGEQYAVVWAETRTTAIAAGGVTQVSRVGIRIYLSVGPGGPPAADFAIQSLTAERAANGQPMVRAAVHNRGGRALDMSGTLTLAAGPGGLSAGPFPAALGTTLAIGDTEPVTILLDKRLPAGPWDAHITLRSGRVERDARATITFPRAGASLPVNTTSAVGAGFAYPVVAGIATLLLGCAALVVVGTRHRRHTRRPG